MNRCQTKIAAVLLGLPLWVTPNQAQDTDAPSKTPGAASAGEEVAPGVLLIGRTSHPRLTESSGVVASRQFPGVLWTHNDGGGAGKQVLYAITREGKSLHEFLIVDVRLHDWEDIAIDNENHLFIGDLGNNDQKRSE